MHSHVHPTRSTAPVHPFVPLIISLGLNLLNAAYTAILLPVLGEENLGSIYGALSVIGISLTRIPIMTAMAHLLQSKEEFRNEDMLSPIATMLLGISAVGCIAIFGVAYLVSPVTSLFVAIPLAVVALLPRFLFWPLWGFALTSRRDDVGRMEALLWGLTVGGILALLGGSAWSLSLPLFATPLARATNYLSIMLLIELWLLAFVDRVKFHPLFRTREGFYTIVSVLYVLIGGYLFSGITPLSVFFVVMMIASPVLHLLFKQYGAKAWLALVLATVLDVLYGMFTLAFAIFPLMELWQTATNESFADTDLFEWIRYGVIFLWGLLMALVLPARLLWRMHKGWRPWKEDTKRSRRQYR